MKLSAGILLYRKSGGKVEVFLVHPGGPYNAKKDIWGIPKGEYTEQEDPLATAKREFEEEIGRPAPVGEYFEIGEFKRSDGKHIKAFAVEADIDITEITSNTVPVEWPPRSGTIIEVPEVDRAEWFELDQAVTKMHKGQDIFIVRLAEKLGFELEPASSAQGALF